MKGRFWILDFGFRILGLVFILLILISGCITHPQNPAATQPSTIAVNPATTQPSYWLDQPSVATASATDFQKLWSACEDVARGHFFKLDRQDYRAGALTTFPLTSAQWWEPWRKDTPTFYDISESSIATMRRSIRFEFSRGAGGSWEVTPKILIERQSIAEGRITSVVRYYAVFGGPPRHGGPPGSREADAGIILPTRYWYPVRRDLDLERQIAKAVQKKVGHQ